MAIFDSVRRWFTGLFVRGVIPRDPIALRAIGVVRNGVREPRPHGWENVRSDIIVREDLVPALEGLDTYSHVIVVFFMQQVGEQERASLQAHPRNDARYPLQGVLALRTPHRPNPIGVSVVPLVRWRRNILRVVGLDALEGTPVLDLKPYIPHYDSVPDARLPDWATSASGGPEER